MSGYLVSPEAKAAHVMLTSDHNSALWYGAST